MTYEIISGSTFSRRDLALLHDIAFFFPDITSCTYVEDAAIVQDVFLVCASVVDLD